MNVDRSRKAPFASTIGAAAAALLCAAAGGADLLVAGTIGEVYKGDSHAGAFEFFGGICLAPAHSLAFDDQHIFVGDANGGILRLDRRTGDFLDLYWVPGDATDLVVHDGDLIVGTSSGDVHRVDPVTGEVEATLESPVEIRAMAVDGDQLYLGGTLGLIYRGDIWTGGFELFGVTCLGPIEALALDDEWLYSGDQTGALLRFHRQGWLQSLVFLPDPVSAMVREGDSMLASASDGTIRRVSLGDLQVMEVVDEMASPIAVDAMAVLPRTGDVNGDFAVGVDDFLAVLAAWGPCAGCPADLDGDGTVGVMDFLAVLAGWD